MSETLPNPPRIAWWQHVRNWLLSKVAVRIYWFVNIALLVGTAIWILRDGMFAEGVLGFVKHIYAFFGDKSPFAVVQPLMWPRIDGLWFVLVLGIISITGILLGLIVGAGVHRGVRSWLLLMLLCAGWLTVLTTWKELVSKGRIWRAMASVSEFDEVSKRLLAHWPNQDGDLAELGPYMAYPISRPRTLMMLKNPQVPGTSLAVSTIERGAEDDLHFQLTGNDLGFWIVRDLKADDEPRGFFSGLEGEYIPVQFTELRPGWFHVLYGYAPILPDENREISRPRR